MCVTCSLAFSAGAAFPASAHAYTQKETIVNSGHGALSPSYLVIHETANPGASAYNHMKLYSRGYAYAVHYVMELDGSVVYHTMKDNRKSWSVGNGNSRVISIELCRATNKADFNKQWKQAVKWSAKYLKKKGWSIERLLSHNDCTLRWGGSDHTDPIGYFEKYGKSWAQFKASVHVELNKLNGISAKTNTKTGTKTNTSTKTSTKTSAYKAGSYKVTASKLYIRSAASTSSKAVSSFKKGSTVNIEKVTKKGGYYWGGYKAYSGKTRYIALAKVSGGASYAAKV